MRRREQAKELRRGKILLTARALVRQTGKTGFSMRALADKSGLSVVTAYNLFGSKQAIMAALLEEDIQSFATRLGRSRKDPLAMFFEAVRLGRVFFERDPDYYRVILSAVYAEANPQYRSTFGAPRRALWRSLVENAVGSGHLESGTSVNALAINLSYVFYAAILEWTSGDTDLEEMDARTRYGFALALQSMATPAHREPLHEIALKMQKRIHRLRTRRRRTPQAVS